MRIAASVLKFASGASSRLRASRLLESDLAKRLMKGGMGSVGIRLLGVVLNLVVAIVLARVLGAHGYGIYAYAYAIASLLATPASFGLPNLIIRETAKAQAQKQWALMRGLWHWANRIAVSLSAVLLLIGVILAFTLKGRYSREQFLTFSWALVFVPLLSLGSLRAASLSGLLKVIQGQLPEIIIRPVLLVAFVLIAAYAMHGHMSPEYAMALHVLALLIAFAIGALLLVKAKPPSLNAVQAPQYNAKQWLISVMPFAFIGAIQTIYTQVDTVMLGMLGNAKDVGIYQVAIRGGNLSFIWLSAIGSVTAPYFARFRYAGDNKRLRRLAVFSARVAAVASVPVALMFVMFGRSIIDIVFGPGYVGAYIALCVLVCGRCIGAWFGPIESMLSMTGHERDTAFVIIVTVILNMVLNWLLISRFGINGAAMATATALIVRRMLAWYLVHRRLSFSCFALARS